MKKLLCLVLTLALSMSAFAGCQKSEKFNDTPSATEQSDIPKNAESGEEPADADKPEYDVPGPSTNKEVVTAEEAPDVYLAVGSDDNAASISYHLKDCKLLKGSEPQKAAWEMIQSLGFRQCPKCNPPQYEEYIE